MINGAKKSNKKNSVGVVALVVAFVALGVALIPRAVEVMYPKPTITQVLSEKVKDAVKEKTDSIKDSVKENVDSVKDKAISFFKKNVNSEKETDEPQKDNSITEEAKTEPASTQQVQQDEFDHEKIKKFAVVFSIAFAFIAFVLGVISYIKREDRRLYQSAFIVSSAAILVNLFWIAIALLLLIYFCFYSNSGTPSSGTSFGFDGNETSSFLMAFVIGAPIILATTFFSGFGMVTLGIVAVVLVIMFIIILFEG